MTTATRRGFLAGALTSGAALPLSIARADEGAAPVAIQPARRTTVRRGRAIAADPAGTVLVVCHDRRRTIAISAPGADGERVVDVGGQPIAVAVAPDARRAAVVTASWDAPGLVLVDLDAEREPRRVDVGPAPFDVAYAAGGERIVVSGGEQEGTVHVLDAEGARVARRTLGTVPRAVAGAGASAWIALAGVDRVVEVDLADGRVRRALLTPPLPDRIALAPDGARMLVAHASRAAERVSEIELGSGALVRRAAGRLPSAVAWAAGGERLVALGGAGAVAVLGDGEPVRHAVGGAPRGLATAGRRAWTVDSLSGAIAEVAL